MTVNARLTAIAEQYSEMLNELIDTTGDAVAREYAVAQGMTGKDRLARIERALRAGVAAARRGARMLGATSMFDELPVILGRRAGLVSLSMPQEPPASEVEQYIDNAIELAKSTESDTAYRALTIIESEAVHEYDVGRTMAETTLLNMSPDRQRMLGFRVATRADIQRAERRDAPQKDRVPVLGRRWNATGDARTCEQCRAKHGDLSVLATSFGGDTAPLHARCRCTTHLWAVAWEQA